MAKTKVELKGKTILVTGSPGFIGANLVIRLLKEMDAGTVISFDPAAQTAEIQPEVRVGSLLFPVLSDVPVFFPGTRSAGITWPVSAGDECLVIFADFQIDEWLISGNEGEPASARCHDLSDAFAFVGFRSRPNALQSFPEQPSFFGQESDS